MKSSPPIPDDIAAALKASPESYWQPIVTEVESAVSGVRHAVLLNHQAAHLLYWAKQGRDAAIARRNADLPYRANVGIALFNDHGQVLVARRIGGPDKEAPAGCWQMPQGGIDADETPSSAAMRELREEIGTDKAFIIAEHNRLLRYDLPEHLIGVAWDGQYRGQLQRWVALRFTGQDTDIDLDSDPENTEFDAWKWVALTELPGLAVPFKRKTYETIAKAFASIAEDIHRSP